MSDNDKEIDNDLESPKPVFGSYRNQESTKPTADADVPTDEEDVRSQTSTDHKPSRIERAVAEEETAEEKEDKPKIKVSSNIPESEKPQLIEDDEEPAKVPNAERKAVFDDTELTEEETQIKHSKVVQVKEPFTELTEADWEKKVLQTGPAFLPVPAYAPEVLYQMLSSRQRTSLASEQEEVLTLSRMSYQYMPRDEVFLKATQDEGREYTQEVVVEDTALRFSEPKFKESGVKLKGEAAVIRAKALSGRGGLLAIPLWHSGFWVTLTAPQSEELIDMEYNVFNSRVTLGRNTDGAIFSNDQVYIAEHLLQLFSKCLYSTTLKNKNDILTKIKLPDLQTIAWGLACLITPNGYKFSRSVYGQDGLSDKIVKGTVDLKKLFWVDNQALSEKQKKHMARRFKENHTDESIAHYQDLFEREIVKTYPINEYTTVTLELPSLESYLEIGENWVQSCIDSVDSVMSVDEKDNVRETMIVDKSKSTIAHQFEHYVRSVNFKETEDDTVVYDDRETIHSFVKSWSEYEEDKDAFIKAVRQFIDESVVSMVATPSVTDSEDNIHPQFPHLVPMDAVYTFFTLVTRKLRNIRDR